MAIVAAVAICGIRWTRRGGDWCTIFRVAVLGVAFGIIGARFYHVITSWNELPDEWWGPFAIWRVAGSACGAGSGSAASSARSSRDAQAPPLRSRLAHRVAPALLVAQGIGRFGNWWNQELFGKPDQPAVGPPTPTSTRPDRVLSPGDPFHPTFLYERPVVLRRLQGSCCSIERRFRGRIRPGAGCSPLYVLAYSIGRLWIEHPLRIDLLHEIGGTA